MTATPAEIEDVNLDDSCEMTSDEEIPDESTALHSSSITNRPP